MVLKKICLSIWDVMKRNDKEGVGTIFETTSAMI